MVLLDSDEVYYYTTVSFKVCDLSPFHYDNDNKLPLDPHKLFSDTRLEWNKLIVLNYHRKLTRISLEC